ncbi:MAG: hypothetical protein AB7W16_26020 [Candidatus Obscuribacterales bacterium]
MDDTQPLNKFSAKTFSLTLVLQAAVLGIFAFLGSLEPSVQASLVGAGIDAEILATIPGSFSRYYVMLAFACAGSMIYLLIESGRSEGSGSLPARGAIMAILLGFIALVGSLQFPLCGDDSYIDFRYVKNWLTGSGIDYNPGERVLGFTSHLHVLLLAALSLPFREPAVPVIAQLANIVLSMLNCLLLAFYIRDLKGSPAVGLAGAAIYALDPYNSQQIIFGKETQMIVSVLIISLWSLEKRHYHAFAWASCLAPFIRPEGLIWSGICLIKLAMVEKRQAWRYVVAPVLAGLSILAVLFALYGTIVPQGMVGKFSMFYPMPAFSMLGKCLWMAGTGVVLPRLTLNDPGLYGAVSILAGPLCIALLAYLARKQSAFLYIPAVIAYLLIFAFKNPPAFGWYLCWFSLIPVFLASEIFARAMDYGKAAVAVFLVLASAILAIQQPVRASGGIESITYQWNPEYHRLLQFDRLLRKVDTAEKSRAKKPVIATPEIGYIGYRYPGPILDLCGLVSPEVIPFGRPDLSRQSDGEAFEINPAIIASLKPDYVITLELFARELLDDRSFKSSYRLLDTLPNDWGGGKGVLLYEKIL